MSESSVRGTIQNFSPKPEKGYYGLQVDTGQGEKWLNGDGEVPDGLSKGDRVKIRAETNGFIDIKELNVSRSYGSGGSGFSDADASGERGNGDNLPKDERILLQVAFKEACESVRSNGSSSGQGEHLDSVGELTNGYFNLLQAQIKDKGGEDL